MISIVLPSLNSIAYIRECLDSIVKQSFLDKELICVDGGSDDGTWEVLKEYSQKYNWIKVYSSAKKSYGYQVNLGILETNGDYLMIVESDDILPENACKILYAAAMEHHVDYVRGVMQDFVQYNDVKMAYVSTYYYSDKDINRKIDLQREPIYRRTNTICIQASLYRLDFIKRYNIAANESIGASYQDTGFCIQVSALSDTCCYIPDVVYYRRRGNEGSSYFVGKQFEKIIDEYEWISNKGYKTGFSHDLVLYSRLYSYYWMMARLTSEYASSFRRRIALELKEYKTDWCKVNLNDDERNMLFELRGEKPFSGLIERKYENINFFLNLFESGNVVIFGTGRYGRVFIDFLIELQNKLEKNIIAAVCDNNKELIGESIRGYTVLSVENAFYRYKDAFFVIVNKYNSREMKHQLLDYGVSRQRIIEVNSLERLDLEQIIIR